MFYKIHPTNSCFANIFTIVGFLFCILFCTVSCQHYHLGKHHHHKHHHHYHPHKRHKHNNESLAIIRPVNKSQVKGYVRFKTNKRKEEKAQVIVGAEIRGLAPGKQYGFHIHQYGDCTHDGQYVGAHFNPHHRSHGLPHSKLKHSGDMGNLLAKDNGVATYKNVLDNVYIWHLIGRSVIIHAMRDDGISQPAGNAGPYIACGVIGYTPSDAVLNQKADEQEDELSLEESTTHPINKKSHKKAILTVIKQPAKQKVNNSVKKPTPSVAKKEVKASTISQKPVIKNKLTKEKPASSSKKPLSAPPLPAPKESKTKPAPAVKPSSPVKSSAPTPSSEAKAQKTEATQ